jgi:hypothetical protein
VRDAWQ